MMAGWLDPQGRWVALRLKELPDWGEYGGNTHTSPPPRANLRGPRLHVKYSGSHVQKAAANFGGEGHICMSGGGGPGTEWGGGKKTH